VSPLSPKSNHGRARAGRAHERTSRVIYLCSWEKRWYAVWSRGRSCLCTENNILHLGLPFGLLAGRWVINSDGWGGARNWISVHV
jgi:hypothetical protein